MPFRSPSVRDRYFNRPQTGLGPNSACRQQPAAEVHACVPKCTCTTTHKRAQPPHPRARALSVAPMPIPPASQTAIAPPPDFLTCRHVLHQLVCISLSTSACLHQLVYISLCSPGVLHGHRSIEFAGYIEGALGQFVGKFVDRSSSSMILSLGIEPVSTGRARGIHAGYSTKGTIMPGTLRVAIGQEPIFAALNTSTRNPPSLRIGTTA
jgi:hypothetical protein